ncbi:hypothetical protein B0H14DRAFT_2617948 [Mycena olivaceomarginata]|nr:hypothetical protein B0H14DRAFT_2617948 [Mycena olivaceomarginata]
MYCQCDVPDPSRRPSRTTPGIEPTVAWAPTRQCCGGSMLSLFRLCVAPGWVPLLASYHHNAPTLLIIFAPVDCIPELSSLFPFPDYLDRYFRQGKGRIGIWALGWRRQWEISGAGGKVVVERDAEYLRTGTVNSTYLAPPLADPYVLILAVKQQNQKYEWTSKMTGVIAGKWTAAPDQRAGKRQAISGSGRIWPAINNT